MNDICKNCGGWKGLHHYKTMQCPVHGKEAPLGRKQEYMTTTFAVDVNADLIAEYKNSAKLAADELDLLGLEYTELDDENKRLRELAEYAFHRKNCEFWGVPDKMGFPQACTCGYEDAKIRAAKQKGDSK